MTSTGPSVSETSYAVLCQRLRGVLVDAVQARPGTAGGIGSVPCLASATLYALLMAHPVDRRGRCRSCRRPGAVLGLRRRRCRVHGEARFWLLLQPGEFLHSRLVCELGLTDLLPAQDSRAHAAVGDLGDADVLPTIEPDLGDQRTEPCQTPAVSPPVPPPRFSAAGWSDPGHGGGDLLHAAAPVPPQDAGWPPVELPRTGSWRPAGSHSCPMHSCRTTVGGLPG